MTAVEAVRAKLVADAAVLALVSSRIFPLVLPQDSVLPAVVLSEANNLSNNTLDAGETLRQVRLQIDCYSKVYLDAKAVEAAISLVLTAQSGVAPEISCYRDSGRDLYDDARQAFRIQTDFMVWL